MKVMFLCRGAEYLGIEYLSACLKAKGHHTALCFDPGFDDTFFFRAPFLKHLNRWPDLVQAVKCFAPDILAVSSLTNTYPYVLGLLREIKKHHRCYTIIGGIHATAIPEAVLQDGLFDAVCIGEGEEALVELVDRLAKGDDPTTINNFCFIRQGEVLRNGLNPLIADLDRLPFADKELFHRHGAFSTTMTVLSGRGCPFACSFCVNDSHRRLYQGQGCYVRQYSPERMIAELRFHLRTLPVKSFNFQDDILTINTAWLGQFSELYARDIGRPFQCNVHPKFVDEEVVRLLKAAGCTSVCMGVQSAVPRVRRELMRRTESNEEIEAAVALFTKHRLSFCLEYIFGLPGETATEIQENFAFNRKLRPSNTSTFSLYPFPGTTIFASLRAKGGLDDATAAKIFRGEGSYHYDSLLDLPDRALSDAAKELFPALTKLPLGPSLFLLRLLSGKHLGWLRSLIGFMFLPLNNFFQFRERMENYYRMYRCRAASVEGPQRVGVKTDDSCRNPDE
jgi:radical SAM superfamily enzyme YgiQ (UPF0313 family)